MKVTRLTPLLGFLTTSVLSVHQEFLDQPKSLTVREGEQVRLDCVVQGKAGTLQWTRDDFGLGTSRDLAGYTRYRMVGSEELGEWHLQISNISVEDDGRYQCQPPVITSGSELRLREDREALVQCISKGGKPASRITWRLEGRLVTEGVEERVEAVEGSKRTVTVSSLQLRGQRNMSGAVLECQADNGEHREVVTTSLSVEYKPSVRLRADKTGSLYEGESVKVRCEAEASPELVEFTWQVAGEEVEEARGAMELIIQAERRLAGERVTCLARNKIGQSSADITLDIQYSPVFVKQPEDVTGNSGERVSLECLVDSNPPGSYTWLWNSQDSESKVVGSGSSLSFFLTSQSAGVYTCKASTEGFPSLTSQASVTVRGPPRILSGREVQYGSQGETVHIVCEATAVPRVQAFHWLFQGEELGTGSKATNFSIVESQEGEVVRSTLVIQHLQQSQYGEYGCRVTNLMGDSFQSIKLKPIDGLPLLIMVSAAIGGLLLTVVLIVIVFTCRRVNRKPRINLDPQTTKTSPQPDRFSNSSSETKAPTLSSLSAGEDLDGSDSLPEYHANYIKSGQPDILSSAGSDIKSYNYSNRAYSNYADQNSLHFQDYGNYGNYSNFPGYDYNNVYSNNSNINSNINSNNVYNNSNVSYGYGTSDPLYNNGRFNAVAQKLSVIGTLSEDLNESSIGTHV